MCSIILNKIINNKDAQGAQGADSAFPKKIDIPKSIEGYKLSNSDYIASKKIILNYINDYRGLTDPEEKENKIKKLRDAFNLYTHCSYEEFEAKAKAKAEAEAEAMRLVAALNNIKNIIFPERNIDSKSSNISASGARRDDEMILILYMPNDYEGRIITPSSKLVMQNIGCDKFMTIKDLYIFNKLTYFDIEDELADKTTTDVASGKQAASAEISNKENYDESQRKDFFDLIRNYDDDGSLCNRFYNAIKVIELTATLKLTRTSGRNSEYLPFNEAFHGIWIHEVSEFFSDFSEKYKESNEDEELLPEDFKKFIAIEDFPKEKLILSDYAKDTRNIMMTTLITDITKNINFDDNEFSTNSLYKGQLDILKKINDGTIALSSCDKKLKAEFKNYYKSKSKYKEKENQTGKQVIDLLKVNNEPTNKDPTNIINNAMSGQIVSNNRLMPIQNFLEESSELKIECEYSQRLDPMGLFGSCSTFQALKNLKRRPIDIKYHCDNVSITGKIGGIDTIELGKTIYYDLKLNLKLKVEIK